jgi:hypothetical protein
VAAVASPGILLFLWNAEERLFLRLHVELPGVLGCLTLTLVQAICRKNCVLVMLLYTAVVYGRTVGGQKAVSCRDNAKFAEERV